MRRLIFVLPVLLFMVVAGYFAYSLRPGHDSRVLPSALLDKEAPAFDLPLLSGSGRLTRDTLIGQPTLVNFFASWCAPCRIEHPVLMRMAERRTIRVIGIAYKDKPDDSSRFLSQLGNPYQTVGMDREGRIALDFGVYGVPETYILDRAGRIRQRFVGPLTPEIVDRDIVPLLKRLGES